MKFSNRLLLFLAGVVCPLGPFLFTNPVANLVAYSWWIFSYLLVSSIATIFSLFPLLGNLGKSLLNCLSFPRIC